MIISIETYSYDLSKGPIKRKNSTTITKRLIQLFLYGKSETNYQCNTVYTDLDKF